MVLIRACCFHHRELFGIPHCAVIKDRFAVPGIEYFHRVGENPVEIIKKYAGSIRLLHLKDYRVGEMPVPEGGLNPADRASMAKFMSNFTNIIQFAEVGEGSMPMKACIEAGLAGGAEYFLVEQDDCYGRDPFDSLRISHDNLVKMGYGEWF